VKGSQPRDGDAPTGRHSNFATIREKPPDAKQLASTNGCLGVDWKRQHMSGRDYQPARRVAQFDVEAERAPLREDPRATGILPERSSAEQWGG